jgi:LacI family transcriptional regulator
MKHIAILVETALASGRSLLAGISQFARERDSWQVFHPTGYLGATELAGLESWRGDGIIARISEPQVLEILLKQGIPVVDVLGNVADSPCPLVKSDDCLIGQWVAQRFLESRHRQFAFVGLQGERWSAEREAGFKAALAGCGPVAVCRLGPQVPGSSTLGERLKELLDWMQQLPRPCGLMIASDQLGPTVMATTRHLGRAIPDDISMIGVDNDLPFCELCRPALSSVEPDHYRAGYEAARLLGELIDGAEPQTMRLEVSPIRLHERGSSDSNAVEDPALVRALKLIRMRACTGVTVEAVARESGLSRSVLQRRFRQELGQTVLEVINGVKIRRAEDLLGFTRLPLAEVAERSGYSSQEYFTAAFRRYVNTSPLAYRRAKQASKA